MHSEGTIKILTLLEIKNVDEFNYNQCLPYIKQPYRFGVEGFPVFIFLSSFCSELNILDAFVHRNRR